MSSLQERVMDLSDIELGIALRDCESLQALSAVLPEDAFLRELVRRWELPVTISTLAISLPVLLYREFYRREYQRSGTYRAMLDSGWDRQEWHSTICPPSV